MWNSDVCRVQLVQGADWFGSGFFCFGRKCVVHVVAGQIREEKFARLAQLQFKVTFLE